jgi:LuxR family maltose regulon positive regulatory protein
VHAGTSGSSSSPHHVAWVSLDARDNDASTFWTYVISAMQTAVGDSGFLPAAAQAVMTAQPRADDTVLTTLLNELEEIDGQVLLILDDYHVIDSQDVHEGLAYLLEYLPPTMHCVISTRSDPPFPLARWRARGELVEVRSADLRFTTTETSEFLGASMHLSVTGDDIATLVSRTEGWAAALQLAGLSLQGRDDIGAAVAKFAGDERFIVDYLVEEVLDRQAPETREFLLATSILDRLSGPLCDAVTGQTEGSATLLQLERSNLFLVPLDDTRSWYRYHHLFADFLRSHLAEQGPARTRQLHGRAASWFRAHGDPADAIRHAFAAEDDVLAAELIELAMPAMRRDRREAELAEWVRLLPDEVVNKRPVLAVQFVGVLAQVSNFDTIKRRLDDIERSVRPADGSWPDEPPEGLIVENDVEFRSLPASISLYRAALALNNGDLQAARDSARESLLLAPSDDELVRAASRAIGGLAAWAMGDLATAQDAYSESLVALRNAGHLADVLGLCVTLGDLCRYQGRLGDALRTYRDAVALVAGKQGAAPVRGTADMHTGIAGILVERDDLAGAATELQRVEELGEHNGLPQNAYRWRIVAARLSEANGDLDGALDLLDEAVIVYNGDYSPNVRPVPAVRAALQIRRGHLDDAEMWARGAKLSSNDELSYLREYEHITFARLLLMRHQSGGDPRALTDAASLLLRLEQAASAGNRVSAQIEIGVLLSLTHQAAGDSPAAEAAIRRAVELGEPEGHVRIFADEGKSLIPLLDALMPPSGGGGYVRRLIASTSRPIKTGRPSQTGLLEPLSERELDVLRLLASDLSGPDIARSLHISLNTMRTHSRNIFRKLQVTSRRGAVRRGAELNLLSQ